MPLEQAHRESLEKAGGLILEQLVAAQTITAEQQSAILAQQDQLATQTGQKPYVGELLEQNGINTSAIKQQLLNMQATARTLLYVHGDFETLRRCEGPSGEINLQAGVPDNKWTLEDMASGDPTKEQTAQLQTRLLQSKVLATAVNALYENDHPIPESSITALRATRDNARADLASTVQALRQAGQSPDALEAVYKALPTPIDTVSQDGIYAGISDAIGQLQQSGMLSAEQAERLLEQERERSGYIDPEFRAQHAHNDKGDTQPSAPRPPLGRFTGMEGSAPPNTTGRGV